MAEQQAVSVCANRNIRFDAPTARDTLRTPREAAETHTLCRERRCMAQSPGRRSKRCGGAHFFALLMAFDSQSSPS
jgi:hypothetical protein